MNHSTDEFRDLAHRGEIFRTEVGSGIQPFTPKYLISGANLSDEDLERFKHFKAKADAPVVLHQSLAAQLGL